MKKVCLYSLVLTVFLGNYVHGWNMPAKLQAVSLPLWNNHIAPFAPYIVKNKAWLWGIGTAAFVGCVWKGRKVYKSYKALEKENKALKVDSAQAKITNIKEIIRTYFPECFLKNNVISSFKMSDKEKKYLSSQDKNLKEAIEENSPYPAEELKSAVEVWETFFRKLLGKYEEYKQNENLRKIENLTKENKTLEETEKTHTEVKRSLEEKLKDIQINLEAKSQECQGLQETNVHLEDSSKKSLEEKQREVEVLKTGKVELEQAKQRLESEIESLKEKAKLREESYQDLVKQEDAWVLKAKDLQRSNEELCSEKEELNNTLKEMQAKIKGLEERIDQVNVQIKEKQKEVESTRKEFLELIKKTQQEFESEKQKCKELGESLERHKKQDEVYRVLIDSLLNNKVDDQRLKSIISDDKNLYYNKDILLGFGEALKNKNKMQYYRDLKLKAEEEVKKYVLEIWGFDLFSLKETSVLKEVAMSLGSAILPGKEDTCPHLVALIEEMPRKLVVYQDADEKIYYHYLNIAFIDLLLQLAKHVYGDERYELLEKNEDGLKHYLDLVNQKSKFYAKLLNLVTSYIQMNVVCDDLDDIKSLGSLLGTLGQGIAQLEKFKNQKGMGDDIPSINRLFKCYEAVYQNVVGMSSIVILQDKLLSCRTPEQQEIKERLKTISDFAFKADDFSNKKPLQLIAQKIINKDFHCQGVQNAEIYSPFQIQRDLKDVEGYHRCQEIFNDLFRLERFEAGEVEDPVDLSTRLKIWEDLLSKLEFPVAVEEKEEISMNSSYSAIIKPESEGSFLLSPFSLKKEISPVKVASNLLDLSLKFGLKLVQLVLYKEIMQKEMEDSNMHLK